MLLPRLDIADRPTDDDDDELQNRRSKQNEQTYLERPHALSAGLEGIVDGVGGIVAMGHEQAVEKTLDAGRM